MGCDKANNQEITAAPEISIHAPAWGATRLYAQYDYRCADFNPRTRVGCDYRYPRCLPYPFPFQSTHPRGVRPVSACSSRTRANFNPRTRMGCDTMALVILMPSRSFQSTHPHGVRLGGETMLYPNLKFQSTHPHGVRPFPSIRVKNATIISIHAPAWGATVSDRRRIRMTDISIHAPAWGATPSKPFPSPAAIFQSTHPHGVRLRRSIPA